MAARFTVDQPGIVRELGHDPDICSNAAFVFDTPLNLKPGDLLELKDGQVFLIVNNVQVPISGKWDR